jgi:hypothetical protein
MSQRYVVRVSYEYYKSKSGCYICCNGCTRMLQISIPNILFVFSDVCCKCVYLDIAYALHLLSKRFIWLLRMCYNYFFRYFLHVFQTHVLNVLSVFRHMLQMLYPDISKVDR